MMSSNLPFDANDWLAEHPEEDRAELEKVWRLSEIADEPFDPDPALVQKMRSSIMDATAARNGRARFFTMRSRPALIAVAAAAAVVIVGLSAIWWFQPIRLSAPAGQTLAAVLPDGSDVLINSGSTIAYERDFGRKSRIVKLTGEAFFDVRGGTGTFEVATFNGEVIVVGTRFNVRAWPTDIRPETSVFVEEGIVHVSSVDEPGRSVILHSGESTTVRNFGTELGEPEVLPPTHRPSWRTDGMVFTDRPLRVILDEIERRFDIEVVTRPDTLEDARVSLYLNRTTNVGTILEMIAGAHDLKVDQTATGYELSTK